MATTTPPRHSLIRRKSTWLGLVFGLVMGGWAMTAQAFFSLGMIPGLYIPQMYYKYGAVYTRAIVPGPTGRPVYVEYSSSGAEAREIGEAIGQYERAQVMAGATYRALLQRLADTREHHPESEVLTAAAYRGKAFKTVTGETIHKPSIASNTLTVVVRPDEQLFSSDGKDLLLLELPIKEGVTPDTSSISLLLSPEGNILHQSSNSIGFRVGFFGKDGQVSDGLRRDRDAQIYGPMPNTVVTLGGYIAGGIAATGNDGKYSMNYFLPSCPGFTFEYTTPAYLELQYKRFNPRGSSYMPYYMVRQDYDYCNGLGVYSLSAAMVIATMATPIKSPHDFPVDLMVLDGAAQLKNVKVADETAYNAETSEHDRYVQDKYDFDGDEKPDFVVPGKKVTRTIDGEEKQVFITTSTDEAELQGIYLSTRHEAAPANTEETAPDFTRLIDTAPDFKDRGLLDSISKDDLKDTDIYVFRESTGQLVAERRGLHEDELYKNYSGVDETQGSFRYTIQLRGSAENTFAISGRTGEANFTKWQSAGGFKEEFQKRTANHLKAGEQVRIIAINRPTGYMGSTRIQLQSALTGNMLNLNSQRIELTPPNLKIWAERKNKIEKGMTRGDEKKQLIGNEGAGLGSDVSIAIYTDWRDSDGSPLPEELADYGYTGRLAKIVAANQLAPAGANNLSQFRIKPGQQVQVIHLPEKVLAKQHLYLQVAGQPENRNPDFSSNGQASGILKYRPTHYVPVQVPLHDEEASELARQAYRKAGRENPQLNLKKPEPMYAWQYRPEMQFSLYELNVEEIRKVDANGLVDQLFDDKKPALASSDKLLEFYYDLLKSEFSELNSWGYEGEKELVLVIGQEEVKIKFGKDQTIRFDNFDHFRSLDVDDFLSIRLYANNDVGNVLLEWAFEYLSVFANADEDFREGNKYYYLSADSPSLEFKSLLAGYNSRREDRKKPETVQWAVEGAGTVSPAIVTSTDTGIFTTQLSMPGVAGTKARVSATLLGGDATAYYKEVIVVPGEPAIITAKLSGKLFAGKIGTVKADVYVTDKQGNPVVSGTSVDFAVVGEGKVSADGAALNRGFARVEIKNADVAGSDNYLVVAVGGIEERFKFDVGAITVALADLDEVYEGQIENLILDVSAASNIDPSTFSVKVNRGAILDKVPTVDAEGNFIFRWHTGFNPGPAEIYYDNGALQKGLKKYTVLPNPSSRIVEKRPVVLIAGTKDQLNYQRSDGQVVDVPLPHEQKIKIIGGANEKINLRLGDIDHPNKTLILELKPAYLERSKFVSGAVVLAKSPGFRYQQSGADGKPVAYNHKGYEITLLNTPNLMQLAAGAGLDLHLDYSAEGNGVLLAWDDLLIVERLGDKYLIKTRNLSEGYDLSEVAVGVRARRVLTLRIEGTRFQLGLDGVVITKDLPSDIVSESTGEVTLLAVQGAELRGLHVSALEPQPLVAVNGSAAAASSVTLDSSGQAELMISLEAGQMSHGYQAVPLWIGEELLTIMVYAPQAMEDLLSGALELGVLSEAEIASLLSFDVRDSKSFVRQANLAAQIQAGGQSDADKIGPLLRVLASLPEGRALSPHIPALERYTREHATPIFLRSLINISADVITERNTPGAGLSYKRVLGLIVFAEMLSEDAGITNYMVSTISKEADLELWLDTMAMPANGWAFFDAPTPQLEQSCTQNVIYAKINEVDTAPYNPCRLRGGEFAAWVSSIRQVAVEYQLDPSNFLLFLRGIRDALPGMSYGMRASLFKTGADEGIAYFDPTVLVVQKAHAILPLIAVAAIRQVARIAMQVGRRLGRNFVGNFIAFSLGKSNTRMHPFIFLLSTGYVYENLCEEEGCLEAPEASDKFWALMRQLMVSMAFEAGRYEVEDTLADNGDYTCRLLSFAHGNMYEMFSIAYYHLQSNVAGGSKIAHIDRVQRVPLFGKLGDKNQEWIRRPDIELKGSSLEQTIWIELKSVQVSQSYKDDRSELPRQDEFLRRFPIMSSRVGDSSKQYHKQFVLDRIAAYGKKHDGNLIGISDGYHWRFQHWKKGYVEVRTRGGGKKRLSRGYPMKTAAEAARGTYLDMLKEHFSEPPQRADMHLVFGANGKMSAVQLNAVFSNPLVENMAGDIDEYLLNEVVKHFLKDPSQIGDIKEAIKKADSVYEVYEEWAEYLSVAERLLGMDLENEIVDDLVNRGRDLAEEYADRNGYCSEDD